ncbi:MAG: molybdopterin molybdenumtransferase MoeA, partial [Oscillatoriales cyanobacterium SM2_1_8]|nr:molybdopterin molybdenumtransferase MoeA [Oscillatoriales cyanobacterium SM2_1_8]
SAMHDFFDDKQRNGSVTLQPGQKLDFRYRVVIHPGDAAAAGIAEVTVHRRPTVALFASGNEVQSLGEPLAVGQVYDANRYGLTALLEQAGCDVQVLGIVPDDRPRLREVLRQALPADAVVSTGGTAVGDSDWVADLLAELGADVAVRSIAIKPGKPLLFATFAQFPALYFGVPGNPVSALVSGWRFLAPVLRQLGGEIRRGEPWRCATLDRLPGAGAREHNLWGTLIWERGYPKFRLAPGVHNSGNIWGMEGTTALAVVPPHTEAIAPGEEVWVWPVLGV